MQSPATEVTHLALNQPSSVAIVIKVNVVSLHESLMITACRNEICDRESDDENKEQETTYDKPPSDDISKPRAGQFSNNLHSYVNNIMKVVSNTTYSYSMNHIRRF